MHSYKRSRKPVRYEHVCEEDNRYVHIGNDTYAVGGDGYLMPIKKGQAPPNLKYFNPSAK
jgi:hypothetical protein